MIRRDYLLGMIDQCAAALGRAIEAARRGQSAVAQAELEQATSALSGKSLSEVLGTSEAELTVTLLRGEPTQVLHHKCLLLSAVLSRAGEIAAMRGNLEESAKCFDKAVRLQLTVPAKERPEFKDLVPSVSQLVETAGVQSLPMGTQAALRQYFEDSGEFAKAEDSLFAMLENSRFEPSLVRFGVQFYERLLNKTDESLLAGNLPREEVEEALAELKARLVKSAS